MNEITVCQTKVHYDTEFEAILGANKAEFKYGEEFVPYQCGKHWHITHKDPTKSIGTGKYYVRCPNCRRILKRSKMKKHKCEGLKI